MANENHKSSSTIIISVLFPLLLMLGSGLSQRSNSRFKSERLKEEAIGVEVPEPFCSYTVRSEGPNGPRLKHAMINSKLYHQISCRPRGGRATDYCLFVYNCTIGNTVTNHVIIDENGCSLHESLFGHVQYESNLVAGIPNPYPVQFPDSGTRIVFNCRTRLSLKARNEECSDYVADCDAGSS